MQRIGVIMAGGSGERFWPVSRHLRPKQLLHLTSPSETMLEEAVTRLAPIIPAEQVFVVTGKHLAEPIRESGVGIPPENMIAEPAKRNTSGALAYAAACAMAHFGVDTDVTMAVVTADHRIGKPELFRATVSRALETAEQQDALVTLGVTPDRAETGYGYIQTRTSFSDDEIPVFEVAAFKEKPGIEEAASFLRAGNYYWNSGMFFWKVSVFLKELDAARPELAQAVRAMANALKQGDYDRVQTLFEDLDDISIDYALMEQAQRVLMVRADFPWDDVGAWTTLDRTHEHDEAGNVAVGDPVLHETRDCIVYNDAGAEKMAVGVVGVEGLVIVTTPDGVLVMPKERAQDVREVVKALKARNAQQL